MDNVLLDVGLPIVLAFVMVGIGLTLTIADFDRQRKTPKPLVVGVIGITIVVPLIAYGLAILLDLPAELAIGLVLLGATAGGTTSNVMTYLAGGNTALSLVLTVVANLATIISIPIWAGVALERWGDAVEAGVNVVVSFMDVAVLLVFLVLLPTSLGMLIRAKKPALAARLENTVSKVSGIVLFVLIIGATVTLDDAWTLLRQAGPATLILACLATATGVLPVDTTTTLDGDAADVGHGENPCSETAHSCELTRMGFRSRWVQATHFDPMPGSDVPPPGDPEL